MDQKILTVKPQISAEEALEVFNQFDQLCQKMLDPDNDIDIIRGKQYKNKKAWRKLALVFNLSIEILEREFYTTQNNIKVVSYQVKATAPNRRYSTAEGVVTSNEKWSKGKSLSAMAGFAQTRATNRAIAYLIAPNDLPSEELTEVTHEEEEHNEKPNITRLISKIRYSQSIDIEEARTLFRKTYGHEWHKGTNGEIQEFITFIDHKEQERLLEEGVL
jgi:hypothetical protein